MNLHELVSELIIDTKGSVTGGLFSLPTADSSLGVFMPELCLCATIVLLLFIRLFDGGRKADLFWVMLIGTGAAMLASAPWKYLGSHPPQFGLDVVSRMEIFTGMLVYDPFTVFMRSLLIGFAFLFAIFTKLSGIPDREDGADIYTLVLGSTLGMCLMASANHLLMVFMAVEMASVPSYALAGMLKGRRTASEAALKYAVYGAGAAGVMLYGISLVAGLMNTAHLPTMAAQLAERLPAMAGPELMVLALGGLMIMVGLAFKLSAVPFHFWCPDVFEGACAEVNAFLSIASKAAALALLVRVAIGFGAIPPDTGITPGARSLAQHRASVNETALLNGSDGGLFALADEAHTQVTSEHHEEHADVSHDRGHATTANIDGLAASRTFMAKLLALLAAVTCTFGNLAAYGQTNIKRLLAYSTIAHAGYMMMSVAAFLVMAGAAPLQAQDAIAALAIYIATYLFMNLGAFAIIAFLRNAMHSEEIADYAGLLRRCPGTVICLSLILFSLVGLPPLAGFIGKFAIFASLVDGYQVSISAGTPAGFLLVLLVVGGMNTAISLFYYLRVVKVMTMEEEPATRPPFVYPEVSLQGAFVWLVTAPTILLMLNWNVLSEWAHAATLYLLAAA
ncbi:MAG: NADH-quinone oxidoreductase subunit N [Planctomycetaceae bacterium]|nr:NADH-quinone oxidoreductase subunit N [Planctomycetales bacterium]MCB9921741.1 NADH-quinone oxidoreductase subunit N [Planctomycetaceae bacterium]